MFAAYCCVCQPAQRRRLGAYQCAMCANKTHSWVECVMTGVVVSVSVCVRGCGPNFDRTRDYARQSAELVRWGMWSCAWCNVNGWAYRYWVIWCYQLILSGMYEFYISVNKQMH